MSWFHKSSVRWLVLGAAVPLLFQGCIAYRPQTSERSTFMARAETQTQGPVSATVAVLSDKESKKLFGVPLAKRGVQPVLLEIKNNDTVPYIFIPRKLDPNYYSSEEASYMAHFSQGKQFLEAGVISVFFFPALGLVPVNYFTVRRANEKIDDLFNEVSLKSNVIMPGETNSGFVFTSVDEGTKHVCVDLVGDQSRKTFHFVATVPGLKPDHTTKDLEARYPEETLTAYDDKQLPELLKGLPCCTTDKKGKKNGDPLNLVIIGELEEIITILTSARWDQTSALTLGSGFSMAKAFIAGENDRYSPVSPLYYDGRPHDIAFQRTRESINQRLHFRLWYTPFRFHSKPVWVGTISRDIGVKFTLKTWYMTTHLIDPNLDDARDYLLSDLIDVEKVSQHGFIANVAAQNSPGPKKNLTKDPYYTDDRRLVMELSTEDTQPAAFKWNPLIGESAPSKS